MRELPCCQRSSHRTDFGLEGSVPGVGASGFEKVVYLLWGIHGGTELICGADDLILFHDLLIGLLFLEHAFSFEGVLVEDSLVDFAEE